MSKHDLLDSLVSPILQQGILPTVLNKFDDFSLPKIRGDNESSFRDSILNGDLTPLEAIKQVKGFQKALTKNSQLFDNWQEKISRFSSRNSGYIPDLMTQPKKNEQIDDLTGVTIVNQEGAKSNFQNSHSSQLDSTVITLEKDDLINPNQGKGLENRSNNKNSRSPFFHTEENSNYSSEKKNTGLRAEYFNNKDFSGEPNLVRFDDNINFNWQNKSPHTIINDNKFSVRWTGMIAPEFNEEYTFTTLSDDGVRLWVNNELIIDSWQNQSRKERSGNITLEAGQLYDFKLEYYEQGGQAVSKLYWASNSQAKEIIPADVFYQKIDLQPLSFNVIQDSLEFGDRLTVEYQIKNTEIGNSADFNVDFYLTKDDQELYLGSQNINGLSSYQQTGILTKELTLPDRSSNFWQGDGNYQIKMRIDGQEVVREINKLNNSNQGLLIDTEEIAITDPYQVNLQGKYFNIVQDSLEYGDTFAVEFQVENSLKTPVNGVKVNFYLSNNQTSDDSIFLGDYTIDELQGHSNTEILTTNLTLPDEVNNFWQENPHYSISMVVDPNNFIEEKNETDNRNLGLAIDLDNVAIYPPYIEPPIEDKIPANQPLIGIIDTGFTANNPDLNYRHFISGKDYIDDDLNSLMVEGEGNEHGSHILGIISATQNNGIGIDGINDDAPVWVSRAIGSGKWANALTEYVDHFKTSSQLNGVVNLSLDLTQIDAQGNITTRYELTPQERQALEYARQNGVLVVVAAGNTAEVMSVLGQASQEFDNIITVGSADGLNRAEYSAYGAGLTLLAEGGTLENPELSTVGDSFGTMSGTSVASAKVTGAVSLIWAVNPDLNYLQVKEILTNTTDDLNTTGWDKETGAGLLNLEKALAKAEITTGVAYDPQDLLIPSTWSGEGLVIATERPVADYFPANGNYYNWASYQIKYGDTLSQIALDTMGSGTSAYYNWIAQHNGISNPNLIYTGQWIEIPQLTSPPPPPPPLPPETFPINDRLTGIYEQNPWLGKPVSNGTDENGFLKQVFEHGYVIWNGIEAIAYEFGSGNTYQVGTGDPRQTISLEGKWKVEFWNNKTLSGSPQWIQFQPLGDITFFAGTDSPPNTQGIGADNFSARWSTTSNFEGGLYNFISQADDGVRVYIDGVKVIEKWAAVEPWSQRDGYILIPEGEHQVVIEYFEQYGIAGQNFKWEKSDLLENWTEDLRPVGYDGTSVHNTYVNTYQRNGDMDDLGYPLNNVHPWENGYVQDFDGGVAGRGAIMKSNANDNSYWVGGQVWQKFLDLGGANYLGYPTTDYIAINGGLDNLENGGGIVQSFSGNLGIPTKIWLSQYGAHPTWGAIGGKYDALGGASSFLGFPTTGEVGIGDGWIRQDFANGYMLWHPNYGAIAYDTKSSNNLPPDNGNGTTDQWHVQYWNNRNLEGESVWSEYQDMSELRFHSGLGAPLGTRGVQEDNFSARWTTTSYFDGGMYQFANQADDGIRIYVDNVLIIDKWQDSPFESRDAYAVISQGYHDVRVEYFEHGGVAANTLHWQQVKTTDQWLGQFYNNMGLNGSPVQPQEVKVYPVSLMDGTSNTVFSMRPVDPLLGGDGFLNENWGTGHEALIPIGDDNFSDRWLKVDYFDQPGIYKFSSNADDGLRIWVDGNLIVDAWNNQTIIQPTGNYQGELFPVNGQYYEWKAYTIKRGDTLSQIALNTMGSGTSAYYNWIAQHNNIADPSKIYAGQRIEIPSLTSPPPQTQIINGIAGKRDTLVSLDQGYHVIEVEHYENGGLAYNQLSWEKVAGQQYQPKNIALMGDPTTSNLFQAGIWEEPWLAEYFNNTGLQGVPVVSKMVDTTSNGLTGGFNLDWRKGSPDKLVNSDNFSARLTTHRAFAEGIYRFNLQSDDGVRLYINGEKIIDLWDNPPFATLSQEIILPTGNHTIQLEYRENGGLAYINFDWDLLSSDNGYQVASDNSDEFNSNFQNIYQQFVNQYGANFVGTPINSLNSEFPYLAPGWISIPEIEPIAMIQEFRGEQGAGAIIMKPDRLLWMTNIDGSPITPANLEPVYVFGEIWELYKQAGGVSRLGYPLSSQKDLGNGAYELDLPNGKIFYKPGMTNATYYEYSNGSLTIPADAWRGEYYNNTTWSGDPVVVRGDSNSDQNINFYWGANSPALGVQADNFSVRWTTYQDFERGTYRFTGNHDDAFQVNVNGQTAINKSGVGGNTKGYGTFTNNGQYLLEAKYIEYGGLAAVNMSYDKASNYVMGLDANNNPNQWIIDNFNAKGGYDQLGVPINDVHGEHKGIVQEFDGGSLGKNALIKSNINGQTYHLTGGYYQVWKQYNLGTPTSDIINYSNGITYRYFDHPTLGQVSAVQSQYGTYPLWGGIRGYYVGKGGLGSPLGAPKTGEYGWNNYTRQDFAGGYILWNGSATAYNYDGSLMFPPPKPPGGGGGSTGQVDDPLLSRQGRDYFLARSKYYITDNIFAQSMYGSSLIGGRGYTEGNCTWYVNGRLLELGANYNALRSMSGNANTWHKNLSNGSTIVSTPQPGDIAQWTTNGQNHVAVVEKVNNDGTIVISESHYDTNWDGGGIGTLHSVRTIKASNPTRYIRVPGVQIDNGGNSGGGNSGTGISINSVKDASDGDNIVFRGGSILVSGNSNTSNMQFYLGNQQLGGTLTYLTDGAFTALLNIPKNSYLGLDEFKVVAQGQKFNSNLWTNIVEYDWNQNYIGTTNGGEPRHVTFERVQGTGFIENKPTWLVIHGWNGKAGDFRDLAGAIEEYDDIWGGGDYQVLTVDWDAARTGTGLNAAATWIDTVAESIKKHNPILGNYSI
jgi:surface antigen